MYDEIFNQEDFENEFKDRSEDLFQEEPNIEFPTPKKGPSLDEMLRKYGMLVIEFSTKSIRHDPGVKK